MGFEERVKGQPSGSYSTVKNRISEQSRDVIDLECTHNADVVTLFDKIQVIINKKLSCNEQIFMQFDSNNSLSLSVSLPQSTTYLSTFNRNIYSYTYIYI